MTTPREQDIVNTLRSTSLDVRRSSEFPALHPSIDTLYGWQGYMYAAPSGEVGAVQPALDEELENAYRQGYAKAADDIADSIESGRIAGGRRKAS